MLPSCGDKKILPSLCHTHHWGWVSQDRSCLLPCPFPPCPPNLHLHGGMELSVVLEPPSPGQGGEAGPRVGCPSETLTPATAQAEAFAQKSAPHLYTGVCSILRGGPCCTGALCEEGTRSTEWSTEGGRLGGILIGRKAVWCPLPCPAPSSSGLVAPSLEALKIRGGGGGHGGETRGLCLVKGTVVGCGCEAQSGDVPDPEGGNRATKAGQAEPRDQVCSALGAGGAGGGVKPNLQLLGSVRTECPINLLHICNFCLPKLGVKGDS